MRELRAGFVLQVTQFRNSIGRISIIIAIPFYVLIFLSITRHAGRTDLDLHAALAPCLAGMWTLVVMLSGATLPDDKRAGTLEPLLASPVNVIVSVLGRTAAVGVLGLVCVVETLVVAGLLFDVRLNVPHPVLFGGTLVATAVAMSGTSAVLAVVFLLGRSAGNFENALVYPVYVLGGVFVPVAFLPEWLHPISRAVFLSWSSDLLRDATSAEQVIDPGRRLMVILGLGLAGVLLGAAAQALVLQRIRRTGEILW